MKKIEDVKAGRLKVHKKNGGAHFGTRESRTASMLQGLHDGVVEVCFMGNLDSYKSCKRRRERKEE
jgi:hypothetical protein